VIPVVKKRKPLTLLILHTLIKEFLPESRFILEREESVPTVMTLSPITTAIVVPVGAERAQALIANGEAYVGNRRHIADQ
jgi:hypothetical protein